MEASKELVTFEGDAWQLDKFLSSYYDKDQIELVRRCLGTLHDAMDETETLRIERMKSRGMGLFLPGNEYFVSVRKTTLALTGLILDIQFTKGFATFVLQVFGVHADTIRKLSQDEKQILLLINAKKISIDPDTDVYEIKDDKDYGYTSDKIKEIIDKLVECGALIRDGTELIIDYFA